MDIWLVRARFPDFRSPVQESASLGGEFRADSIQALVFSALRENTSDGRESAAAQESVVARRRCLAARRNNYRNPGLPKSRTSQPVRCPGASCSGRPIRANDVVKTEFLETKPCSCAWDSIARHHLA